MSDLDAIRACAHRYSRGIDRLDLELMQSAYWPEGTDDHGTFIGNAHEFCAHVVGSHARFTGTMHCILNHAIELDDDGVSAHGEIYNVAYLFRITAEGERAVDTWWGRYLDTYEQRDGEWRILHRICVHDFDTTNVGAPPMPVAAHLFRQGGEDRANPMPLGTLPPKPPS